MTLECRPPGRGNHTPVIVVIEDSKHSPKPILVKRGDVLTIAGQLLKVSKVFA